MANHYTYRIYAISDVPGLLRDAEENGTALERINLRKLARALSSSEVYNDERSVYVIFVDGQLQAVGSRQWVSYPPERPDDDTDAWLEEAAQAHARVLNLYADSHPNNADVIEADSILKKSQYAGLARTGDFDDRALDVFGKAGYLESWETGKAYVAGTRLFHDGVTYLVMQAVTAQAHQPPGSEGMLAVYRPVDPAAGTADDPKTLISGMDAVAGLYYRYDGVVWKCLRDLIPTFVGRLPGDAGMETFWERVNV